MLLKYFYDGSLAQASYMVGCQATRQALVVDPARDVAPYVQAARQEGLRITHVTETHIHADFVSGSRELAHASGARLLLSAMGGPDWGYGIADPPATPLRDGEAFKVGNVRVEVIHTPGHTPEHVVFQITDAAGADRPMGIFTGDFSSSSIGRPDL
jgi:hydroxyacylglutathione hydrolase